MQTMVQVALSSTLFALASGLAQASPNDYWVDASGQKSTLTHIDQAMALAVPGDRILVYPGHYPAFFFSKGVEVRGIGERPDEVVIDRVDYHVNWPNLNHYSVLANLRVCGDGWWNDLAITGNELQRGVLWVDQVETCAGVFLHGDPDFYVFLSGVEIAPQPGRGFLHTAFDFGGGQMDVWDSQITGWSSEGGAPAASALRQSFGSRVRLADSTLRGGDGGEGSGVEAGAHAVMGLSDPAQEHLIAIGGTVLQGGRGMAAPGGHAVQAVEQVELGAAFPRPGPGLPMGEKFVDCTVSAYGFDPYLSLVAKSDPAGAPFCHQWSAALMLPTSVRQATYHWDRLAVPSAWEWSPFERQDAQVLPVSAWSQCVRDESRIAHFMQSILWDPVNHRMITSNPVVARHEYQ